MVLTVPKQQNMRRLKISRSITNRETESLGRYLQEVSRAKLLTADEEVQLVKRIRSGDTSALEALTKANLRFVISVAKQYQNLGLSFSDLISEGNLGLLRATEKFDETKGFKFISYAVWWIRQSILQSLAEHSRIIRLPQHKVGYLNKINKAFTALEQEFEREPTSDELALVMDAELSEIHAALGIAGRKVSLDAPVSSGDELSLMDLIQDTNIRSTDHEVSHNESLRHEIYRSLASLKEKQAEVVKLYFGIGDETPLSLYDISLRLQLSSERVRQIKDEAIAKLKSTTRCGRLKAYLD